MNDRRAVWVGALYVGHERRNRGELGFCLVEIRGKVIEAAPGLEQDGKSFILECANQCAQYPGFCQILQAAGAFRCIQHDLEYERPDTGIFCRFRREKSRDRVGYVVCPAEGKVVRYVRLKYLSF